MLLLLSVPAKPAFDSDRKHLYIDRYTHAVKAQRPFCTYIVFFNTYSCFPDFPAGSLVGVTWGYLLLCGLDESLAPTLLLPHHSTANSLLLLRAVLGSLGAQHVLAYEDYVLTLTLDENWS